MFGYKWCFPHLHSLPNQLLCCIWKVLCNENDAASLVAQMVKKLPAVRETWARSLGWEDPLEKGEATHSSILSWRIPKGQRSLAGYSPWGRRVRHNWASKHTQWKWWGFLWLQTSYSYVFKSLSHSSLHIGCLNLTSLLRKIKNLLCESCRLHCKRGSPIFMLLQQNATREDN